MELIRSLGQVQETRSHINQVYPVQEVSFLLLVAVSCGHQGWSDIEDFGNGNLEWLRRYLPYENGIPTCQNIARIVRAIVPESLLAALVEWVNQHRQRNGQAIIALDGKDMKGVQRYGKTSLSQVSAFDVQEGLVLYHKATLGKGQEIEAVRSLIECLSIEGCILTMDALHCQADTLKQVVDKGATALVQVKKNQPKLFEAVDDTFQAYWKKAEVDHVSLTTSEKGHGRQENRTLYQLPLSLSGELKKKWPMLVSAIAVTRERCVKGVWSYEAAYFVCTGELTLEKAMQATRGHWRTENQQHWVLDVVFGEDAQKTYVGKGPENMACFRRLAMNLLKKDPTKLSNPRKMNKAKYDHDYRHRLLFSEF